MAHSVGVTHEPEISEFDLDPRSDVMLVLASDGVWDVMSAEDIRKVRPRSCSYLFKSTFRRTCQRFQKKRPLFLEEWHLRVGDSAHKRM